jgi:hypothetical protein
MCTSKDCTCLFNVPFGAKYHSTYRVSALGKHTFSAEAFLWGKALVSGKNVV